MTGTSEPNKRLDGMGAIGKAFKFVFGNLGHLLATASLTLFMLILIQTCLSFALPEFGSKVTAIVAATIAEDPAALDTAIAEFYAIDYLWFFEFVAFVLSSIFVSMFAVRWHRSALFGKEAQNTGFGLELSGSLGRYFLMATALSVGYTLCTVFISYIPAPVGIAFWIFVIYAFSRLSLALPAAALGIENFAFIDAWKATRTHGLAVFGAAALMIVASALLCILIAILYFILAGLIAGSLLGVLIANGSIEEVPNLLALLLLVLPGIALIYAMFTGLITSFYSYIYLQIGKPPAWVEEQGEA